MNYEDTIQEVFVGGRLSFYEFAQNAILWSQFLKTRNQAFILDFNWLEYAVFIGFLLLAC